MPVDLVRDAAIDVLLRVFDRGVHLDVALDKTLRRKAVGDRGRRFLTQLVYGTVRYKLLCDHVLRRLCHQPLEDLPSPLLAVLRMGIYQSLFLSQVTHPAMVHTSVDLAKRRGHSGLAKLANAVLRRAPQALEEVALPSFAEAPLPHLSVKYSMPEWLVGLWVEAHGLEETERLCAASNLPAPVSLRVNTMKTSAEVLRGLLAKSGLTAEQRTVVPEELTLQEFSPVSRTKWFQQGLFLIQDAASMLPAHLLEPRAGERVLDMCAAPGGKTTHLAALAEDKSVVVAMDQDARRLKLVRENSERLSVASIRLVCGDGRHAPLARGQDFRTPAAFDRVLVDAPCSGLGTLRRHPDLKWRLTPEALPRLAAQQRALLLSAGELCKNGGLVVYSVCTFTRHETQDLVQAVLRETNLVLEDGPEFLNPWKIATGQYLTLPSGAVWDGFFLTRFRKRS